MQFVRYIDNIKITVFEIDRNETVCFQEEHSDGHIHYCSLKEVVIKGPQKVCKALHREGYKLPENFEKNFAQILLEILEN